MRKCLGPLTQKWWVMPSARQRWPGARLFSKTATCSFPTSDVHDTRTLFEYTKGRFLFNENSRLLERTTRFNLAEFKSLAANSINQKPQDIIEFEKLADGAYNRVFLITMRDGFKFVGRIAYPMLEPHDLAIASEVATMDFLRLHGLPVPQVFDYSATPNNAAGTEFVFMEFVPGKCLSDLPSDLVSQEDRLNIVRQLVELESRIFDLRFPTSGSLYYSKDIEDGVAVEYSNPLAKGSFCVGPDTDMDLWWGRRSDLAVDCGPYLDNEAVISAGARKEIAYLEEFARPVHPYFRGYREFYDYQEQDPQKHRKLLEKYLQIAPQLVPQGPSTRPVLRHRNLAPENIMVSPPHKITGLVNWQNCSIRPLFLQSGIPESLHNPEWLEADSPKEPSLPANFHDLDDMQQARQKRIFHSRQIHYTYITATEKANPEHMGIMKIPGSDVRRDLYLAAGNLWHGDGFPLKLSLIQLSRRWEKLQDKRAGAPKDFPFQFTDDEEHEAVSMHKVRIDAQNAFNLTRTFIGLEDPDGEVLPEEYEEVKACADGFKAAMLAAETSEEDKRIVEECWYFNDFNEEEYK
ncbi:phosphotransferase [Phyllosticta paracitricarpa]|uniref:Phosphotransferase n=1 Tax=Phyllosticta paracitricarpa TaxID=2016321 RepID=A0ABR1N425_9PEZI